MGLRFSNRTFGHETDLRIYLTIVVHYAYIVALLALAHSRHLAIAYTHVVAPNASMDCALSAATISAHTRVLPGMRCRNPNDETRMTIQ